VTVTTTGQATSGLPQVTRFLAAVVAPTTLVTGLLFYFGWMHAYWFFDYFGVSSTLLGLGTVDLVMRSVDALFVPAIVLGFAVLAGLWLHGGLRSRLTVRRRSLVPRLVVAMLVAGLLLASGGLLSVFTPTVLSRRVALAPLCLGGGALLLLFAVRLRRAHRASGQPVAPAVAVAEWAGVFVLVTLSLFWAATDYSAAVGRTQARQYAAGLASQPDAVLYSERSLRLAGPGVREVRCEDPEAGYQFRYDGLKLILQSGGQYVLLPGEWTRTTGVAFVIPRTDSLRLELHPASTGAGRLPASC
jgi:hypothetical protein